MANDTRTAWPPLMSNAQAAFAVASIFQVLLVGLGSTMCVHLSTETNVPQKLTRSCLPKNVRFVEGKQSGDPLQRIRNGCPPGP